jgi:putative DNA primase/helicase
VSRAFSDEQLRILSARGISPEQAEAAGVVPIDDESQLGPAFDAADVHGETTVPDYWTVANGYLPGLLFFWRSPDGVTVVPQLRPDIPVVIDSDVKKYIFPPDAPSVLHAASDPTAVIDGSTVLITEGTIQTLAAANAAPPDVAVYGIAGCQSWMKAGVPSRDLSVVKGAEVFIVLDADAATNLNVYSAGVSLREAAIAEGAETVRFVRVPGGGKSGLDDVLASRSPEDRTTYLSTLISIARNRPKSEKPEQPAATKPRAKGSGGVEAESPYFTTTGGLQVKTLAESVIGNRPAALTRENKIALYMNGVYRIDGTGFLSEVANLLGENFRTSHQGNAEAYAVGMLKLGGIELPDRATQPLMNCRNVMVDLRTGESLPHDPSYFATVQLPVEWDPDATCPTYEAWAREQVGYQLDDLEESSSVMLDPSVTPTKAVFLFGPSRSGKGTFLRVLGALAGPDNVSSVSLHQLAENRFMAANVYGKILNASGDLSAAHVEDISIFKMLTGEDQITADRKYGSQFSFTNRALFAFSANELPTVGESSRAYAERVKPFLFSNSFAGAEDPTLERQIMTELPGILVRLQRAYARRMDRGRPLATDPAIQAVFEEASDRVRQFVRECCQVVPVEVDRGGTRGGNQSTISQLYTAFQRWAANEGKATLAKSKLKMRLSNVPGVVEQVSSGKSRGWNLRILPDSEWGSTATQSIARSVVEVSQNGSSKDAAFQELGTLYLGTQPYRDVERTSSSGDLEENIHAVGREGDSERTKFQPTSASAEINQPVEQGAVAADPLDSLLPLALPVDRTALWRLCADCDTPEELTDSGFMYGCPRCHGAMFGNVADKGV